MNPTCGKCGQAMRYNVPRLGPDGGYVHAGTNSLLCAAPTTGSPPPSRDAIVEEHQTTSLEDLFPTVFKAIRALKSVPNAQGEKKMSDLVQRLEAAGWNDAAQKGFEEAVAAGVPLSVADLIRDVSKLCSEAAIALATSERRCAELEKGARPPEGWISVEERLPEKQIGKFLVTNNLNARDAFGFMSHVWLATLLHHSAEMGYYAFDDYDNRAPQNITHWQPLPQPPGGKS